VRVILLEKVKGLGEAGAVVEVAAGHARNLLFPRGLAQEATADNLAKREAQLVREARQAERLRHEARDAATRLQGREVRVQAKAGASGRLFGSITAADVAAAVERQLGVSVDRRRIDLTEPLKTLGAHGVTVHLHGELAAQITVRIELA